MISKTAKTSIMLAALALSCNQKDPHEKFNPLTEDPVQSRARGVSACSGAVSSSRSLKTITTAIRDIILSNSKLIADRNGIKKGEEATVELFIGVGDDGKTFLGGGTVRCSDCKMRSLPPEVKEKIEERLDGKFVVAPSNACHFIMRQEINPQ